MIWWSPHLRVGGCTVREREKKNLPVDGEIGERPLQTPPSLSSLSGARDGLVGSGNIADEEGLGRRRHPPWDQQIRADAAEGGGEHVRVRGRARFVGVADGVGGAERTAPGRSTEAGAPAGRVACVGVGRPQLLPQVLRASHAWRTSRWLL
ncbi:hypothetical protein MUK42_24089 [Musa troglodytarum]|uniref:Uncharacterized protein n=1 Tax=Musa troglodytarum TaxID=320322 RepID=A0A9E7GNV5_9LILI|nr:hypothetical protein MUK42_24089 [Musa troglodytarum]